MARRYGKTNKSSTEKSLLEKKREKRAAARLAAEAKSRRENPRSSPVRKISSPLSSNSYRFVQDNTNYNPVGDLTSIHQRENDIQSNAPEEGYSIDATRAEEQINIEKQAEREQSTQQPIMEEQQPNLPNGYQNSNQHDDANIEYYSQNMESYYDDQHNQQENLHHQPPPTAAAAAAEMMESPTRNPPISPRKQPTTSARIQASHAEDVLALSLELENTRSALKGANAQLTNVQSHNDELQSQLVVQNNGNNVQQQQFTQSSSSSQLMEELRMEKIRSKAAEEDAALALELAKDAQAVKEECEEWLTRSLDEIEFWKNKCLLMEKELGKQPQQQQQDQQQQSVEEEAGDDDNDNKRLVRFKEDCPPSPVVSLEGNDATVVVDESEKMHPPPEYPFHPSPKGDTSWSTPQTTGNRRLMTGTPNSESTPSSSSKSAVAHGRLFLHNASPLLSPTGEMSPHPSIRASELMKRSAETRRILRERLSSSGRLDSSGPSPPPSMAQIAAVSSSTKGGNNATSNDASYNQGAVVYKNVANVLHESGNRLKLDRKKWTSLTLDGETASAGLESMVKDYCGQVEGKIADLTAFCDHLEVDFINSR